MTCADWTPAVDALVDGSLPDADREPLERHLAGCAACRADVAALQRIMAETTELPRGLRPPHDLWPAIAPQLIETAPAPGWWQRPAPLVAAALFLVVASSGLTALWFDRGGLTARPEMPAAVVSLEADYRRTADELTRALNRQRAELAPATIATLERTLQLIDQAIAESREALARDPGNRTLRDLFWAAHRRKIDLLEQASRLPVRS